MKIRRTGGSSWKSVLLATSLLTALAGGFALSPAGFAAETPAPADVVADQAEGDRVGGDAAGKRCQWPGKNLKFWGPRDDPGTSEAYVSGCAEGKQGRTRISINHSRTGHWYDNVRSVVKYQVVGVGGTMRQTPRTCENSGCSINVVVNGTVDQAQLCWVGRFSLFGAEGQEKCTSLKTFVKYPIGQ